MARLKVVARPRQKFTWIANEKARKAAYKKRMQGLIKKVHELTILCDMSACMVFYSPDDNKLVAWPSQEEAKSLIDHYFSLPDLQRNLKAEDQESFIKSNTKKLETKIANSQRVIAGYEMDLLMFQLHNGRGVDDLSGTEVKKLMAFLQKKMTSLGKELGYAKHPYIEDVNEPIMEDETPKALDFASKWGESGFRPMERGSVYYIDKWILFDDEPKVQNHCDETDPLPRVASHGFNLNVVPDDDEEDMQNIYPGESSRSGGADDA
ncbi:unnamed protein product [Microthlaspi erraticum]|uniref:MADS-box domain-containing protein n=1 Tax=Microthlaspi erraticum TaxID=1685480 RepID=A0A6D2IP04_9BRAS|nr:unnamed protein product [Microthlaspi erraticum]